MASNLFLQDELADVDYLDTQAGGVKSLPKNKGNMGTNP